MLATDYLPFSSKARTYEQLPGYDLEALPLQDLPNESQSNFGETEQNPEIRLVAGSNSSQIPSEPVDLEEFVPYKLSLAEKALFPEFYHHFKKSFSALSMDNRAYVSKTAADFKASYIGTEQDIEASIIRVEHDFDSKFRQCLDPELLKDFESWFFTRPSVESSLMTALNIESDHVSYVVRMNELLREGRTDIDPLFEFLVAFGHSDESIWSHVILVFSKYFSSGSRKKFMNETADTWKKENVSLKRQVQGFALDMRNKGFDEKGSGKKGSNNDLPALFSFLLWIFSLIAWLILFAIIFGAIR